MYKILTIEDDPIILSNLCTILDLEGYQTIGAENGIEGIKKLQEYNPDLIICDIIMPGMDGYEVIKAIRNADTKFRDLPFIFLSSKTTQEDERTGLELGANAYVTKPFIPSKLLETIKTFLK